MGAPIVKAYFDNIFTRDNLSNNREIIIWWNKGRGLLNVLALIYMIIHFSIILIVFKNGWILFIANDCFSVHCHKYYFFHRLVDRTDHFTDIQIRNKLCKDGTSNKKVGVYLGSVLYINSFSLGYTLSIKKVSTLKCINFVMLCCMNNF